jgi:hypothetical protein
LEVSLHTIPYLHQSPCPPGVTLAKLKELFDGDRLQRAYGVNVESIQVIEPVSPETVFVVNAVINGHRLTFRLASGCVVRGGKRACPDSASAHYICKHILRALLEVAGLIPDLPDPLLAPTLCKGRPSTTQRGEGYAADVTRQRKSPRKAASGEKQDEAQACGKVTYELGKDTELYISSNVAHSFIDFSRYCFRSAKPVPMANGLEKHERNFVSKFL